MRNKKIYLDMVLNIGSAGLTVAVLQVLIYPLLSRQLDADTYGFIISIFSFVILISDSLGKSINNIRLIRNDENSAKNGDYNVILSLFLVICLLITGIGVAFYNMQLSMSITQKIIWVVVAGLTLINAYIIVYFRIRINYVKVFINAIFDSAGLVLGYIVYRLNGDYVYIFLFEQVLQLIFLIKTTNLLKEPFKRTINFRKILTDCILLAISVFLSQSVVQADKLLLLPMLGGEVVAVYYTATLLGKVVYLAMAPITSVILSYIAGVDSLSKQQFKKYMILSTGACFVLSILMIIISRPILGLLFPAYVDGAMDLIVYTTINVFIYTLVSLVNPIVMKYCDIYWQIVINGVGALLYIVLSLICLKIYGIVGFCIGIAISHFIKLIIMLFVYSRKKKITKEREELCDGK